MGFVQLCLGLFFVFLCLLLWREMVSAYFSHCYVYHGLFIMVFIEHNLSQSVIKSMWFLTLSAVWATWNHTFMNVSAYYWVQWFWSLPEKVRSYWTFRFFKVNHFETIERNICRWWLNKLFIACVCVCVCLCVCVTNCYVADVDWAPDEVSRVQLFLSDILVLSHDVLWWKINNCFIMTEIKLLKCLQTNML